MSFQGSRRHTVVGGMRGGPAELSELVLDLTLDWRKSFQRAADCRHGTTLNRIGKYFIHWDFLNIMDSYGQ